MVKLKMLALLSLITISSLLFISFNKKKAAKVLIYHRTAAFVHKCIPAGIEAFKKLGKDNNIDFSFTEDSTQFNDKNLEKFSAIMFFNTTGNVLSDSGQLAMEKFIRSGKGFIGIHSASDTEYGWPWYNQLVGAWFKNHPEQQEAVMKVLPTYYQTAVGLPAEWKMSEEWYNFRDTHWDKTTALILLDEKSYKGGNNGDPHPIAWYQPFDGGRSFYMGVGHKDETFKDPLYMKFLLEGIRYAIGK